MRSQQPTGGARTWPPDSREAPENPLCPAKVHHVGEPFAAKRVEKGDSFLPPLGPGEKNQTREERGHKGCDNLFAKLCNSPVLITAGLHCSVFCELLGPHPVPPRHSQHPGGTGAFRNPASARILIFLPFKIQISREKP